MIEYRKKNFSVRAIKLEKGECSITRHTDARIWSKISPRDLMVRLIFIIP